MAKRILMSVYFVGVLCLPLQAIDYGAYKHGNLLDSAFKSYPYATGADKTNLLAAIANVNEACGLNLDANAIVPPDPRLGLPAVPPDFDISGLLAQLPPIPDVPSTPPTPPTPPTPGAGSGGSSGGTGGSGGEDLGGAPGLPGGGEDKKPPAGGGPAGADNAQLGAQAVQKCLGCHANGRGPTKSAASIISDVNNPAKAKKVASMMQNEAKLSSQQQTALREYAKSQAGR